MSKELAITYILGLRDTQSDQEDIDTMSEIDAIFEESIEKVISLGYEFKLGHMQIEEK